MSLTDATVDITVTVREDNTVAVRTVSGRDDTVAKTLTGTSLSSAAPKPSGPSGGLGGGLCPGCRQGNA